MAIVMESAAPDPVEAAMQAFLEAAAASEAVYAMDDIHRMILEGTVFRMLEEKGGMFHASAWGGMHPGEGPPRELPPRAAASDEQAERRRKQNAAAKAELAKKMMKESAFHTEEQKAAACERIDAWALAQGAAA